MEYGSICNSKKFTVNIYIRSYWDVWDARYFLSTVSDVFADPTMTVGRRWHPGMEKKQTQTRRGRWANVQVSLWTSSNSL